MKMTPIMLLNLYSERGVVRIKKWKEAYTILVEVARHVQQI